MTFNITDYFRTISVLDHGHVQLFDGMVQDPKLKIVNAARVSFGKESLELTEKDLRLIAFLQKHEHYSPFRHSYFSFRVKAPISVYRQWWKYQIGSNWEELDGVGPIVIPETNWSEQSFRYVSASEEFYIPKEIRVQSKDNKQGSFGKLEVLPNGEDPVEFFRAGCQEAYERYLYLRDAGAAKEQIRGLLPQNLYTECVWTCSVQTLMYFLHQRLKEDAQWEIRQYALTILDLIRPMFEPLEIFNE